MEKSLVLVGSENYYSTRLIKKLKEENTVFDVVNPRHLNMNNYNNKKNKFLLISFGAYSLEIFNPIRSKFGGRYLEQFCLDNSIQDIVMDFPTSIELDFLNQNTNDVESKLSDFESIEVFRNLIKYWSTGDRDFLERYKNTEHKIYFQEHFLTNKVDHVFVDVGAYTGDSLKLFKQKFQTYLSSFLFEPNKTIMLNEKLIEGKDRLVNLACGAQNKECFLSMNGINSKITIFQEENSTSVNSITLDKFFENEKKIPTFIKIDAEGADIDVLTGAMHICKSHRPIIALSVYHKPTHIFEGINKLLSFNYDQIYLRKYSNYNAETVLFGI
jgi:FkbM family methyltransferase